MSAKAFSTAPVRFCLLEQGQIQTMTKLQESLRAVLDGAWRKLRSAAIDWSYYLEGNIPTNELFVQMRTNAIPSNSFFLLLSMSTIIATCGLIANSAPAIIGAMIIAPLMAPIISLAYGIACVDRRLALLSAITIAAGVVATIAISYAGVAIVGSRIAGSEILARASPSLLDLGVALAAGCAGAFAQVRPSIASSVAGVAIAVALVPPLAVTGIGLALGQEATSDTGLSLGGIGFDSGGIGIAKGAFLLFLTNLIGIVAIAALVFLIQRYGHWKKALPVIAVIVVGSFGLMPALNRTLHEIYVKNRVASLYAQYHYEPSEIDFEKSAQKIQHLHVAYRSGVLHVSADILATRDRLEGMQERLDAFQKRLSTDIGEPVVIELEIKPIEVLRAKSGSMGTR